MPRKRNQTENQSTERRRSKPLSLSPLSLEDALRGAMATGGPPEMPKGKRTATKRRLIGTGKSRQSASKKDG